MIETLYWENNTLFLLDQTKLPHNIEYVECKTYNETIDAIKTMVVRGAPAIGVTAAYAMALAELEGADLNIAGNEIKSARPTAINLFWAVDKVLKNVEEGKDAVSTAIQMEKEDIEINKKIGEYGNAVIDENTPKMTSDERKAVERSYLGKKATIKIDRPIGYIHKKGEKVLNYPINYGYLPGVIGGDGENMDVYLLGVKEIVDSYKGKIIAIIHRENDSEDKLVMAPVGMKFTEKEIASAVEFQEKYYKTYIELSKK